MRNIIKSGKRTGRRRSGSLGKIIMAMILVNMWLPQIKAEATKDYPCCLMEAEPVIDGRIEDVAWKMCPEAGGFFVLNGGYAANERQTFFRSFRSKDSIFFAVRCLEPAPDKIQATANDWDDLWQQDSIELFFIPPGASTFVQLIANAKGARWYAIGDKADKVSDWQATAAIGTGEWTLELKIPFAILGKTPLNGEQWKISVARNNLTDLSARLNTSWTALKGGFADKAHFGIFTFKAAALDAKSLADNAKTVDKEYYTYMLNEIKRLNSKTKNCGDILEQAGKYPALKQETLSLQSAWARASALFSQESPDFQSLLKDFGACGNIDKKLNDLKMRCKFERLFEK